MFAAIDPIRIGFIFLGAALTSFVFGAKILYSGFCGLRNAEYPLSEDTTLTGFWGILAASIIFLFGLIVIGCGIATSILGFLRLRQLF